MTQMNLSKKQTQTHRHSEQTCLPMERGRDGVGVWDYQMKTIIYRENAVLISAIEQSDSVIHYIHTYSFFFIFFSIMVYHRPLNIVPYAIQ